MIDTKLLGDTLRPVSTAVIDYQGFYYIDAGNAGRQFRKGNGKAFGLIETGDLGNKFDQFRYLQ